VSRNERERATASRRLALEVLTDVLAPGSDAFAQDLLDERFGRSRMSVPDRRLAADIVYGVIRRLATLDAVLAAYAARPRSAIEEKVRHILRMGIYEILLHERVPQYAAVDECVRLALEWEGGRSTGFVNGVLRAIARDVTFTEAPDPEKPRESFTLAPGRACVFGKAVLPPPAEHGRYLSVELSYPTWLVVRWLARYGASRTRELCASGNEPPLLFVRPNALKNLPGELMEHLAEEGVAAELSASGRTLLLPPHTDVGALRAFSEGRFQVQDDAAAAAARFLNPRPGECVLDLCAAPGGKTCHLAELMRNEGRVTAVDISAKRLDRVTENALRLGLDIIEVVEGDGGDFAVQNSGRFDRVLLDAPCSNTAVLRRRVEARWRLSDAALARLARKETQLLDAALRSLKPGGTLVYCTCSLEPEENSRLVRSVLSRNRGFRLDAEDVIMPSRGGGDGISMARIIRSVSSGSATP